MAVLGVDAGTTSCKVTAFSIEGSILYCAKKEYMIHHPKQGWAELNPNDVWNAVKKCIKETATHINESIEALAISSQGEGIVALNKKLESIGNIIVSYDLRAIQETNQLKKHFGKPFFFQKGGQILASMGSVTKIMWLMENEKSNQLPQYYVCVGDYILMKLTGELATDRSLASRTMMYDIERETWNKELLEYINLSEKQLCHIYEAGTPVGNVRKSVLEELHLSGCPLVVLGGHDQACAMLGLGANKIGQVAYSLGTTETLVCSMDSFCTELYQYGLPCYPHVIPQKYITIPGNFTGGNLMKWYRDNFAEAEKAKSRIENRDVYEILMEEMGNEPSGLLVLPHFTVTGSPWNDAESMGVIAGLKLTTTKDQYIRGLQEGVTFEILLNMMLLNKIGMSVDSLFAVGGGTKSNKLMQLKADILNVPIYIPEIIEASCAGAALLALKGMDASQDIESIWNNNYKEMRTFFPNTCKVEKYKSLFETYKKLYPLTKKITE